MEQLLLPALTSVVTGVVVGILTWRVSVATMRKDELRRMRRDALTELAANRYDLQGDPFSRALNAAFVVWAESKTVTSALVDFQASIVGGDAATSQATLLRILRGMAEELRLDLGHLSDEFLLTPFNTRPASIRPGMRP